jgi:hypothetical protein
MKIRKIINSKLSYAIYIVLGFVFISCGNGESTINYSEKTVNEFNEMKKPVILLSKDDSWVGFGVQLIDGDGKVHYMGNMSSFANGLGSSYNVGDTIK